MGLFSFIGEVVAAPLRITATVASTAVKATGKALTGDFDGVGEEAVKGVGEVADTAEKVVDAAAEED